MDERYSELTESVRARFAAKLAPPNNDGCVLWTGSVAPRYGLIRVGDRRKVGVHRIAWMLAHERDWPAGLVALHSCDTPRCCNASHISAGTQRDNVHDCIRKGRRANVRGSAHKSSLLNETKVSEIRAAVASGERYKVIAARYGVKPKTIRNVISGQCWRHVPHEPDRRPPTPLAGDALARLAAYAEARSKP